MKTKSLMFIGLLVTFMSLVVSPTSYAQTQEPPNYSGIAYNKVDLTELGILENIKVKQSENGVAIDFMVNGDTYHLQATQFGEDAAGIKYATQADRTGNSFNVLKSGTSFTGTVVNNKISPINQTDKQNLGFVISQNVQEDNLQEAIQEVQADNATTLQASKESILTSPSPQFKSSSSGINLFSSDIHVLASGTTIPFLLSSGTSEGWVFSSHTTQQYFRVSNLRYSITYNWPSDGVSLWYDYMNSTQAYHSPAWPSAGYTNVGGSWDIDATKGMFVAETSVTALVKNIPIGYTVYDTKSLGN
ncbi:hypothetical protein [Saccharibacillus sp. O23]|uniref:hypothetical protein n=1 Tax=Saccharibacillus sp. O23 TaxID=2009338 RepID=UPI001179CC21|nr:hypothetical protein [Saccharibacillus sp. O23]